MIKIRNGQKSEPLNTYDSHINLKHITRVKSLDTLCDKVLSYPWWQCRPMCLFGWCYL